MSKDKREHNWKKEQPLLATTGEITTRRFAENHSNKVEWVRVKKNKR
ncbi:MAG: hypothetical protein NTU76_02580 [Candidatus Taylorbacteria bacterium]|nr:hypothetical protein [Candidatus Taylorbacteria bacterium]